MPESISGSSEGRLTTAELLVVARDSEPGATERMLELWRYEDLLPKAERTGQDGTRPVWTYPVGARVQLHALLQLRTMTRSPDLLRAALWSEGHPVPTHRARTSMIAALRKLSSDLDQEVAKRAAAIRLDPGPDRPQVLADLARDLASSRSSGVPRFGRQHLGDRIRAFEALLHLGLDDFPSLGQMDDQTARAIERAMGIDQGRRYRPAGAGPWLTGPPAEGLVLFQEVGSLPRLIRALESADEGELDFARQFAHTLLTGLAAFSQMADAFAGHHNASGLAALETLSQSPMTRIMVVALLVSMMRLPEFSENLRVIGTALDRTLSLEAGARRLAAMPEAEREARLAPLTWPDQRRITRLISSFVATESSSSASKTD